METTAESKTTRTISPESREKMKDIVREIISLKEPNVHSLTKNQLNKIVMDEMRSALAILVRSGEVEYSETINNYHFKLKA